MTRIRGLKRANQFFVLWVVGLSTLAFAQRPARPAKEFDTKSRCLVLEDLKVDENTSETEFVLFNCGDVAATSWSVAYTLIYEDGFTNVTRVISETVDSVDFFSHEVRGGLHPGERRAEVQTIHGLRLGVPGGPVDYDVSIESAYFEDSSSCGDETQIAKFAGATVERAITSTEWVARLESEPLSSNARAKSRLDTLSSELSDISKQNGGGAAAAVRRELRSTLELIDMGLTAKRVEAVDAVEMLKDWLQRKLEIARSQIRTNQSKYSKSCSP